MVHGVFACSISILNWTISMYCLLYQCFALISMFCLQKLISISMFCLQKLISISMFCTPKVIPYLISTKSSRASYSISCWVHLPMVAWWRVRLSSYLCAKVIKTWVSWCAPLLAELVLAVTLQGVLGDLLNRLGVYLRIYLCYSYAVIW